MNNELFATMWMEEFPKNKIEQKLFSEESAAFYTEGLTVFAAK